MQFGKQALVSFSNTIKIARVRKTSWVICTPRGINTFQNDGDIAVDIFSQQYINDNEEKSVLTENLITEVTYLIIHFIDS